MSSKNLASSSSSSTLSSNTTATSTSRTGGRTSIHYPLKPASVQDLKAKFDPSKASDTTDSSKPTGPGKAKTTTSSPLSNRGGAQRSSFGKGTTSTSSSSSTTVTSLSHSLQAAAQRKTESSSSSSATKFNSSPRPFSPPSSSNSNRPSTPTSVTLSSSSSSSSLSSLPSSVSSSSAVSSRGKAWEPKAAPKNSWSSSGGKAQPDKTGEGRVELPVMHITSTGSEVKVEVQADGSGDGVKLRVNNTNRKRTETGSRYMGPKVSEAKAVFGSPQKTATEETTTTSTSKPHARMDSPKSEKKIVKVDSPPVQRTNRLIAKEITIQRLDSGVTITSYKDSSNDTSKTKTTTSPTTTTTTTTSSPSSTAGKSTTDAGNKIREIPVQRASSKKQTAKEEAKEELPFRQVKLRKTKTLDQDIKTENGDKADNAAKATKAAKVAKTASPTDKLSVTRTSSADLDNKRLSRKISNERFERLKFDFERGVPTEYSPRRGSESSDHIELQQKARELTAPQEDGTPVIAKKKKEESIFTEGLKVSDFVKQVNKMNPEMEAQPKWKAKKSRSVPSSAASSEAGDNFYQGIAGDEEGSEDEDDIYEQVSHTAPVPAPALSSTDGEQDGDSSKAPGRRLGVYRKQKGDKKKDKRAANTRLAGEQEAPEEIVAGVNKIHSDGEDGWDASGGSSSGTEYEDVGQSEEDGEICDERDGGNEDVYEVLEDYCRPPDNVSNKGKTKTFNKLKKIFKKGKKNKTYTNSAGTDSEGDVIEDTDEEEGQNIERLSRTSSERSSGRLTRDDNTLNSISTVASAPTTASNSDDIAHSAQGQTATSMASNLPPPPPLPPRAARNLQQLPENSPPLPPRNPALTNKATLGVPSLETVVPVSPTTKSGNSYRNNGDKQNRHSFGQSSQDGSDSGSHSSSKLEYIDYDPASSQTLERIDKADPPGSRRKRSIFGRKSSSIPSRPVSTASTTSSVYMYPDMSTFPGLKGDDVENDSLYMDLEDEQIYGKTSDIYVSQFESEPLYQWYSKDKMIQNIRSDKSTTSSGDISDEEYLDQGEEEAPETVYEDVERLLEKNNITQDDIVSKPSNNESVRRNKNGEKKDIKSTPQRRSIIEDVFKNGGSLHRALWCQMPEVIKSGLLEKLSDQEKKVQEAMFEIMTSEASYLKSLNILISVFLKAPEFSADMSDRSVVTRRDRTILFSNIGNIRDISANFLADLEARWQESCVLNDVCDIMYKHSCKNFEPYVRYCSNQSFQDRALNTLKQTPEFNEAVKRLEQNSSCQFLPLASFLLLPMQRITRLPLLVDAICHRMEVGSPQHSSAKKALESLRKVAKRCDEGAKKMQQAEQMCILASSIEFKIKEFPLVSASRFLIKQGELTQIKGETTVRKLSKLLGSNKEHVHLLLFNDILLIAKKKGSTYQVRDYCQRNSLHVEAIDNADKSRHISPGVATGLGHLLFLAMLANHDNKQVELVLSCKSESDRTRWIDALSSLQSQLDSERIYDYWDCPQHQCVKKYLAQQPDELTLEESDVVNVTRKLNDGWCEGERIRDGEKGWFPANHTEEINNSHVRARNLRIRYRLLMASEEYTQMEISKEK